MNSWITLTAENAFIFSLFQFILAGLILSVTLWYRWKDPSALPDARFHPLPAALFLLCARFALNCLEGFRGFYLHEPLRHPGLSLAGAVLEPISFLILGSFFLQVPFRRPLILLAGGLAATLPACLLAPDPSRWATGLSEAFSIGILLTVILLLLRRGLRGEGTRSLALGLFALATTARLLENSVLSPTDPPSSPLWILATSLTLGALVLLAIVVDRMSGNLPVQFFLRLNLLFIFLAGLLMIEITESTRRQHIDIAERELQHLSEYLRGHAIHFSNRGDSEGEILSKEDITRRIVSDFGKISDMRTVAIHVGRSRVVFEIDDQGMIRKRLLPAEEPGTRAPPRPQRIAGSLLWTSLPIIDGERVLGSVQIAKSLEAMNERIAQALIVIFTSFTLTVILSAALIGLIVNRADTTMKNQFRRIEDTQRQLMQAAKLASIGELAGGVAHEINNPVGIILARSDYLKALAEREKLSPDQIEDIEAIHRQAGRVSRIVSDLLTFSRRHPLERIPLQLNEVIRRSLEFVGPRIREGRIHLRTRFRDGLPPIFGDRDRLEQVFLNVLNNAVDALPEGGTIQVETGTTRDGEGEKVCARIVDSGTGIPHENIKKIFDPFFSTKEEGKGTGLGLSISYGIVRDHKGNIEVESEPGRGTTFTLSFPAGTAGG